MKKAELLYEAIGEIDDSYIDEAGRPFRKKRSASVFTRIAIAAALVLVIVLSNIAFFASVRSFLPASWNDGAAEITTHYTHEYHRNDSAAEAPTPDTDSYSDVKLIGYLPEEEIDLFGSEALVIIRFEGVQEFTVIKVSQKRLNILAESVGENGLDKAGADSEIYVWLCDGNGKVFSPYLRRSPGNVGYGSLFEYSPEISPSEEFANYLSGIILGAG